VIARIEGLEHGGGRRHAGREQKSAGLGLLQHRQHLFRLTDGGIVRPAIDEAGRIGIVLIADVGGRHMDRRHDRLGDRVHMAHGLRGETALRPPGTR
jgi:hypothetical protein